MSIKAKDIAEMLNISPASVSLVLNNKPGVSESTRLKVLNKLEELGCVDLIPEKNDDKKTILFLIYRKRGAVVEQSPYFSQIFSGVVEGVEFQIKNLGYKLMITYADESNIVSEIEKIRQEEIDGLLLLGTEMVDDQMKLFKNMNVPTVLVDNYMKSENIDSVAINNEQGVDIAVSYLVKMGHKEIGYLHVKEDANNFQERFFGFLRSAQENNLELDDNYIIDFSTTGDDAVYVELKKRLAELEKMPTAFFADNDIVAIWTMKILRELGYSIPSDVSIVGFDDISICELLDPPLTTISTPKFEIGCVAVNTLFNKIENKSVGNGIQKIELKTKLITRSSVIKYD